MTAPVVELVDVFTATPGEGNRAGVVLDASGLTTTEMQAIAAATEASETAFGIPSSDPASFDLEVRYFSATRELPLCGHATIGFHWLRARRLALASQVLRVKTGAGVLPVAIERENTLVRVTMTQGPYHVIATPTGELAERILDALGLAPSDVVPDLPIQVVSTGHAKVLVPIRSHTKLQDLAPHRERLLALEPLALATGFFVLTLDRRRDDVLYHGRMFAPAMGVFEDPVTGNANGPAGCYLVTHGIVPVPTSGVVEYAAVQGEKMGRPGLIDVRVHVIGGRIDRVQISGQAVSTG